MDNHIWGGSDPPRNAEFRGQCCSEIDVALLGQGEKHNRQLFTSAHQKAPIYDTN